MLEEFMAPGTSYVVSSSVGFRVTGAGGNLISDAAVSLLSGVILRRLGGFLGFDLRAGVESLTIVNFSSMSSWRSSRVTSISWSWDRITNHSWKFGCCGLLRWSWSFLSAGQ